jgi:glycerophosphoryl diester phosphodiesterase
LVAYCQAQGIQLLAWTVNEEADMQRLITLGVKEIITDYPDRALAVRQKLLPHK